MGCDPFGCDHQVTPALPQKESTGDAALFVSTGRKLFRA
jgi:hypothetical protein